MPQLDHLIEALRLAKEIEAAAELDFHDRTEGMIDAKRKCQQAEDRMKAAREQANNARLAVHCRIEAQTHSSFDDELIEAQRQSE